MLSKANKDDIKKICYPKLIKMFYMYLYMFLSFFTARGPLKRDGYMQFGRFSYGLEDVITTFTQDLETSPDDVFMTSSKPCANVLLWCL